MFYIKKRKKEKKLLSKIKFVFLESKMHFSKCFQKSLLYFTLLETRKKKSFKHKTCTYINNNQGIKIEK